ncbi:hypothetical protein LINPERHAP2_LOCUS10261 [Linum perenne]
MENMNKIVVVVLVSLMMILLLGAQPCFAGRVLLDSMPAAGSASVKASHG